MQKTFEARGFSIQGKARGANGDSHVADAEAGLFAVCDGVSGQNSPSAASQTAIDTFRESARAISPSAGPSEMSIALERAFSEASKRIHALGKNEAEQARPATTATAIVLRGSWAVLAHVGDSRAYLIRGGSIRALTEDHTYGAEMVRKGQWTPEQARTNPHRNALTRALGPREYVHAEILQIELSPGDVILLTTDGVHDALPAASLQELALKAGTALEPRALVDAAMQASGRDDTTAVVLHFIQPPVREEITARHKVDALGRVPLFQYLSYPELIKVTNLTKKLEVPAGSTIIQEGTEGSDMYIVLSGGLEVVKEGKLLATRSAGEMIGEMAMIDGSPRFASVRASHRSVLLRILRDPLFELMQKEPPLAVKLMWALCKLQNDRIKQTTERLIEGTKPDLPFRKE